MANDPTTVFEPPTEWHDREQSAAMCCDGAAPGIGSDWDDDALRRLIEAIPTPIYTTDAQGRITFYNQAAADLADRRPELGKDEWCVTWRLYIQGRVAAGADVLRRRGRDALPAKVVPLYRA